MRQSPLRLALLRRQNAARLRRIDSDLAAIEREIAARIGADEDLAERRRILTSIPGIAETTAAAIITLAPELGTMGGPQAAKLAGLAPIVRQSGRWRGQAFVRGGRAALREALYMPALAAMRCNPDLTAFAGRLKAAGKAAKVTITATMRKLLLLANALVRDRRAWDRAALPAAAMMSGSLSSDTRNWPGLSPHPCMLPRATRERAIGGAAQP